MTNSAITKIPTGIEGFDEIALGGFPQGRTTLVAGTAGSAKTIFAVQFLAEGVVQHGEPGVFVTFEESPTEIRRNVLSLGYDIAAWEAEDKWRFVDASPDPDERSETVGAYDLSALIARIEHAMSQVGAVRVSLDSIGAVITQFEQVAAVRSGLLRIAGALRAAKVTSVLTAERLEDYGAIARLGVEEFVADNVVILRHVLHAEKRRRTIEILKFRGTNHQRGEFPFTIVPERGIIVIPLTSMELQQKSADIRITSGNVDIDRMTNGGLFRDSVVLVSGPTGTGKTLISTEFIAGGVTAGERCLLFAYEESRDQLFRNARGWGFDFDKMESDGMLKVVCAYPESMALEDHLVHIRDATAEFNPDRVAVDSLSAIERISTMQGTREFIIALSSYFKHRELAALFTSTAENLLGGTSITETHISTLTDSIILLRYVEMYGEVRRGLTVLKMRGSSHEHDIREFTIDGSGMHIGRPFNNVVGILSGKTTHVAAGELERLAGMFGEGP